jgi:hypothetical protein
MHINKSILFLIFQQYLGNYHPGISGKPTPSPIIRIAQFNQNRYKLFKMYNKIIQQYLIFIILHIYTNILLYII